MKKLCFCSIIFFQGILFFISCAGDLEMRKRQSIASRNLGEAYMMQGKHTAALQEFIKAQQSYPDDPYLHYDLGLVYMAKEKPDLAIFNFQKAIKLKADFAAAKNSLGTVYLVKEDWDKAIAVFKEVTEDLLYATPHYPLTNLGFAYFSKKDFKLAETYYLQALNKEPEYAVAWRGLGKTYLSTNRVSNAIEAFEKAIRISPATAQLHMDLANAYKTNRNFKKAYESYMKVVELDPDGSLGKEARRLSSGLK
ncbi:MAG: tetratricopeptide repeat protein [Thermodesulfobacteriota bacterium]